MKTENTFLGHPQSGLSVSMAILQSLDGSYMVGRSVVRRGVPVGQVEESITLGVADNRWGGGLSLEAARSVVADATAHLLSTGYKVTAPVRTPAKAKPSTGMGLS